MQKLEKYYNMGRNSNLFCFVKFQDVDWKKGLEGEKAIPVDGGSNQGKIMKLVIRAR